MKKKSQRQDPCATTHPPATGPNAAVIALPGRPGPDGRAALLLGVRRADEREAPRNEERRPDTLHAAGEDEEDGARGQPARHGRAREDDDPRREHATSSEPVSHRAAHQHQRREHERVGLDHPLDLGDPHPQLALHDGESDVDDRPVEERHARPEHRDHEGPARVAHRRGVYAEAFAVRYRLHRTPGGPVIMAVDYAYPPQLARFLRHAWEAMPDAPSSWTRRTSSAC